LLKKALAATGHRSTSEMVDERELRFYCNNRNNVPNLRAS